MHISKLDKNFIEKLRSRDNQGNQIQDINVSDYRALATALNVIKSGTLNLSLRTNVCSSYVSMLNSSVLKSFDKCLDTDLERSENTPFLDKETLTHILNKLHFIIDSIVGKVNHISRELGTSNLVSLENISDAVCDCVFTEVEWTESEALPIIKNILNAQCMGGISLYKSTRIITLIQSKSLKNQALFGPKPSWVRYANFVYSSKIKCRTSNNIQERILILRDRRNPLTISTISGVLNYLKIIDQKDKIFLDNQPTIFEYSIISQSNGDIDINLSMVIGAVNEILRILANHPFDLSIARGLMSLVFTNTDPSKLERILLKSKYLELVNTKQKKGVSKRIFVQYRNKGMNRLIQCLRFDIKRPRSLCKTIEFYYSINRSNKKSFNCDYKDSTP